MKYGSMWKDYPELDRIFNHKRISKADKQRGSHILVKIMSKFENTKITPKKPGFTSSHQAALKSELRQLEANLCNVFQYFNDRKQNSKQHELEGKLRDPDQFYETVAEITWLSKWICKGILMDIEPLGKNKKGPDAKLTINGKDVFCEVTALKIHATMEQKYQQENQIIEKISGIEPKYYIAITTDRELTDCDIDELSEFIKKEIKRNNAKKHFSSCYGDIHLEFADCYKHVVVEICPIPKIDMKNNQIMSIPYKTDIERKLCNAICDKLCQLNEIKYSPTVRDGAKVLVIDYGRPLDSLNLHPFFIDSYIKNIIGKVEPWDNHLLQFNSLLLKDLSAIIMVPHTADKNYTPSCYINEKADSIISRDEATEITCIKQPDTV